MDPRLLRAYNEELAYLRETAREFGEEHETVAGRLGLKTPTDPDPYVERLMEGVAFLNARVQLKLQDQYPQFTEHLLQAIQPHYLAPTPSIAVVQLEPLDSDPGLAAGVAVPRQTELVAIAEDQGGAPVTFRTGHEVKLWPVKIVEAEYLSSRAAVAAYAGRANVRAEAGLRLRIASTAKVPLANLPISELPVYLDGSEAIPGELYRQIAGESLAVLAGPPGKEAEWRRLDLPRQHGFGDDEALLPAEQRSFRGYRLLSEYFACPERFLFVTLTDLAKGFAKCDEQCDIVILFGRNAPALTGAVEPANLKLFATPAINLFEMQLGRVPVTPFEHEFHIIPDRTRPLDYELFRLTEVKAFGRDNADPRPVAPLYAFGALLYDWRDALFYTTQIRTRRLSTREQRVRRRSDYVGTETWISITAPGEAERLEGINELAVRGLVTNRELPETLTFRGDSHFQLTGFPVTRVRVVRAPTKPRPPMGLNDAAWRVLGHLTPNYATLAPIDRDDPSVLRDHLALYGRQDDPGLRRQIDAVTGVRARMVTRRVPGLDRMAVARGLRITLRLDDAGFDNGRMFLFAAVLEQFLAEFTTVNSFTECVFETPLEGNFARWPPRIGRRHNI
ncbi:type VI secretion system baseplate subunit TssF [Sphingomonas jatrophae]|uniref:Type VI secretion system protein ImpG n=1 Tax=Sphingomonas jatrophae TaxID=1166337 RepID=A0A1I6LKE2_9SPHN|nr:type VI secretion system baseplate subunit TssF [Sphingomonas jatrophae]SFS03752.1 type VI secretion system protein ImpG [Sphingomonas jatrophae]